MGQYQDRIVGLALGTIRRCRAQFVADMDPNRDPLITDAKNISKSCKIDAVEITVGTYGQVENLEICNENIQWLKSLQYVSIHAPVIDRAHWTGSQTRHMLAKIVEVYQTINAKQIIFHADGPPPHGWHTDQQCSICIENLAPSTKISPSQLRDLLNEYSPAFFCMDISHALLHSKQHVKLLLSMLDTRIAQFHISGTLDGHEHQRLIYADEAFKEAFTFVKNINRPYILEEDLDSYDVAISEIKELWRLLNDDLPAQSDKAT
jgi:hypothetical protein